MARSRPPEPPEAPDVLYQAPLAEFTALRNSLAKKAGSSGSAIRRLRKPSLPAWAVNQLYWQRRAAWDGLVAAAGRVRAAHGRRLSGKDADVEAAEAAHRKAIRAVADEIRGLLREAGEATTASTLAAVVETLQALPSPEPPGRLTRPLKPLGLEALSGLVNTDRAALRAVTRTPGSAGATRGSGRRSRAVTDREARARKRAADARRREAARLDAEIREAATAERRAVADLTRAKQALARVEREREHLAERMRFLEKRATTAADLVGLHEARGREAAETRASLVRRREELDLAD